MRFNWQKFLAVFFITLGVAVAIWAVVEQTRQLNRPQDSRSQADQSPRVDVSWGNLTTRIEKGQSASLDLFINSQTFQLSALEFWGSITGLPQGEVRFETLTTPGLQTISQQVKTQGNTILFHLVYFSDITHVSLFTTNNAKLPIGRLVMTPTQNRAVEVQLNRETSAVASYTSPNLALNFLDGGKKTATFDVFQPGQGGADQGDGKKECNLNCATDTECKAQYICFQGRCRHPQVKEDEKCGSKPDLGIHRGCNEYCSDSRECDGQYTCYYNFCRNPKNLENTTCANPPSPTPRVTTSGTGGRPVASPSPSPGVATITKIVSRPLASPSPTATSSSGLVATTSTLRVTPSPVASTTPTVQPAPSLLPTVDEVPTSSQPSVWSLLSRVLLGLVFLLALGFGSWWWRQNRTPGMPRDY